MTDALIHHLKEGAPAALGPDDSEFSVSGQIADAIIASGLTDRPISDLIEQVMGRLVQAGVPLARMMVGFRILHPLFDGMTIGWTDDEGVDVEYFQALREDNPDFTLSPFYWMIKENVLELPLRLDQDDMVDKFPLLQRLRNEGYTGYYARVVSFGEGPMEVGTTDGLALSWSSKEPEGFSARDISIMQQILAPLSLALRVMIKDQIAKNTLNAFHGPLVGERILAGSVKRGDGERLTAALWYSDLRNSTGLADQLSVEGFLELLNVYFDCAAGAVIEEGGQVLDIVGDAILAFFPADVAGEEAASTSALRAALKAQERLAAAKARQCPCAAEINFGVGVHFGDVVFGNAGTRERLKFGVIGRTVNEVARTQDMSKLLGQPIVATDQVVSRARSEPGLRLNDMGLHDLRGIPVAKRLWALRQNLQLSPANGQ
ncbi:MAG: adenylate/guanylate cyclase domain-containing protein [Methyloceanibacter sp.]|jgi:adenylate cyclase